MPPSPQALAAGVHSTLYGYTYKIAVLVPCPYPFVAYVRAFTSTKHHQHPARLPSRTILHLPRPIRAGQLCTTSSTLWRTTSRHDIKGAPRLNTPPAIPRLFLHALSPNTFQTCCGRGAIAEETDQRTRRAQRAFQILCTLWSPPLRARQRRRGATSKHSSAGAAVITLYNVCSQTHLLCYVCALLRHPVLP